MLYRGNVSYKNNWYTLIIFKNSYYFATNNILSTCFAIFPSVSIHSFIHQLLYSTLLGPGLFFSFVIFFTQTVGVLGRVISPSQGRYLNTWQHKTQNNRIHRHPSMPWAEFEPTILTFKRANTVHALDRVAIVIGLLVINRTLLWMICNSTCMRNRWNKEFQIVYFGPSH
jgi:hypothetical protein